MKLSEFDKFDPKELDVFAEAVPLPSGKGPLIAYGENSQVVISGADGELGVPDCLVECYHIDGNGVPTIVIHTPEYELEDVLDFLTAI